eukprot:798778_1
MEKWNIRRGLRVQRLPHCNKFNMMFEDSDNTNALRKDIWIMIAVYLFEVIVVLLTHKSPLKRFTMFDYLMHHVPWAVMVGSILYLDPVFVSQTWQSIGFTFKHHVQVKTTGMKILLLMALCFPEIIESVRALLTTKHMHPMITVSALLSATWAPYYHIVIGILPMAKHMRRKP